MIGDVIFFTLVWIFFGCITGMFVLWNDIARDRARLDEFCGVVIWWPFFWIKGVYKFVLWILLNFVGFVKTGFRMLVRGQY